jgi:hypothetical protein
MRRQTRTEEAYNAAKRKAYQTYEHDKFPYRETFASIATDLRFLETKDEELKPPSAEKSSMFSNEEQEE